MLPRYFSNTFQCAPQISGLWGTTLAVLRACLVTGWNARSAASITQNAGVATMTFPSSGHGFVANSVVRISGASPSLWNGDYRVISASSTTITFSCDPSLIAASGTIECKFAPCDWEEPFSGTNEAVFRSTALESPRPYVRVVDNQDFYTAFTLYESMTSVNAGAGAMGARNIGRSNNPSSDNSARQWRLYADNRCVYLFVDRQNDGTWRHGNGAFGDFQKLISTDSYNSFLIGGTGLTPFGYLHHTNNTSVGFIHRAYTGQVSAVTLGLVALGGVSYSGAGPLTGPLDPAQNSIVLSPIYILETGNKLRGLAPGMLAICNASSYAQNTVIDHPVGRGILQKSGSEAGGTLFISLEPWVYA